MKILKFFEHKIDNYVILTLKDTDWDSFIDSICPEYKTAYISDEELQLRVVELDSNNATEFLEILPDQGNIMSGDFGEILSYLLFKDRHSKRKVDGPKKWRWKQEKNVAAPYTDVILYSMKNKRPSKDDLLISVESKMKAVANKSYHPIQNAINGAEKDYVSRIANSLSWIRKKYKDELVKQGANRMAILEVINTINRFIQSETHGSYSKKIKAIAIVDSEFIDDELKKDVEITPIDGFDLTVFVVAIKDLQTAYETVFQNIPAL